MSDTSLKKLKNAVKGLNSSKTPEEKLESLNHAFSIFSKETARLEKAYIELQTQFKEVNTELEVSNSKLKHKIFEFHIMMNYMTSLLNHMSQGILFVGLDGIITTYNRAAEKILRTPSSHVLFNPFWEIFPDTLLGFSMRQALGSTSAPAQSIVAINTDDNPVIELEVDTSFILEDPHVEEGMEIPPFDFNKGMIILLKDITEIRQLQTIASRNDRMKELGEMAAMVAHEIRNPLGGIKGFASLLKRDLSRQPDLEKMAQYIIEGTNHLDKLVSDILNYARPLHMQFEQVDVCQLVMEVRQHVLMDADLSRKIDIKIESKTNKLPALIDQRLVKSAILNILINAIEAMPEGGKIAINLFKKEDFAVIEVADTGVGIPQDNLEKIFSPFFTTKPTGHGFGLAEVHRIIQAHQGNIEVRSETDQGTTFKIKIPLKL